MSHFTTMTQDSYGVDLSPNQTTCHSEHPLLPCHHNQKRGLGLYSRSSNVFFSLVGVVWPVHHNLLPPSCHNKFTDCRNNG